MMHAQFVGTISTDRVCGLITGESQQEIADFARWLMDRFSHLRPAGHGHTMTTNGITYSMVFELR